MNNSKINYFRFFLLAVFVNILSQAIHETGHMITYQMYHRNPTWGFIGLVQIWDTPPLNSNGWIETNAPDGSSGWLRLDSSPSGKTEMVVEAAAGPLASLVFTILGLWIAYKNRNVALKLISLMFSLSTSFTMMAYYLRSPLRMIGDEFDIASQLGISKGIIEVVLGVAFILCFLLGLGLLDTWRIRLSWLSMIILGGVATGILLNIADQWVRIFVNQGSQFFQSVLGYSLPVLMVYLLTVLGIFVWEFKAKEIISIAKAG